MENLVKHFFSQFLLQRPGDRRKDEITAISLALGNLIAERTKTPFYRIRLRSTHCGRNPHRRLRISRTAVTLWRSRYHAWQNFLKPLYKDVLNCFLRASFCKSILSKDFYWGRRKFVGKFFGLGPDFLSSANHGPDDILLHEKFTVKHEEAKTTWNKIPRSF